MRISVSNISKIIGRNKYTTDEEIRFLLNDLQAQKTNTERPKKYVAPKKSRRIEKYSKRGIHMEPVTIKKLNEESENKIEKPSGYLIKRLDNLDLDIYGLVDSFEYDENNEPIKIIEIKNRNRYYYMSKSDYDQISLYIWMKQLNGVFVQQLKGQLQKKEISIDEATNHVENVIIPLLEEKLSIFV